MARPRTRPIPEKIDYSSAETPVDDLTEYTVGESALSADLDTALQTVEQPVDTEPPAGYITLDGVTYPLNKSGKLTHDRNGVPYKLPLSIAFFKQIGGGRPSMPMQKRALLTRLRELNFDIVEEVVSRYRDPNVSEKTKNHMLQLIIDRTMPTLKSVEVTDHSPYRPSDRYVINVVSVPPANNSAPTLNATVIPTVIPTVAPTVIPTVAPTVTPTVAPTVTPTVIPTVAPTVIPTVTPERQAESSESSESSGLSSITPLSGHTPLSGMPEHAVSQLEAIRARIKRATNHDQ